MAITLRGTPLATGGGSSPRVVNKPAGVVAGDLLLLHVGTSDAVTPVVPAGFTLVTGAEISGTSSIRIYRKVAGPSEGADYTVTFASGTGNAGIVALVGATVLAIDAVAVSSSADRVWPSVTTTVANTLLLCFGTFATGLSLAPDAAMTERYDSVSSATRLYLMTQSLAAAGASGTRTATGGSTTSYKKVTLAVAEVAPPAAPSDLTATPITSHRVDVTWTDNSSDELNFELERSTTGVGGWTLIASPLANAESYSDTSLPNSTDVYYRIRAVNINGNSAWSSIASALLITPGRAPLTPRLYLWQPEVVLAARVNWPTAVYPVGHFDVDGISAGSIAAVTAGMTVLLGSAAGLDDYGRQRIRKDPEGVRIFVGRSSYGNHDGELIVTDNAYVTVWDDRRVWSKTPYIAPDGAIYKDHDMPVEDRTTEPPPVAVMGAGSAGTIGLQGTPGVFFVSFYGGDSYATADGATIVSYLWDIGDGTLSDGTLTSAAITISFQAGRRYVSLTVTDSNGKTHISYRPVVADDPDERISFDAFQIESHRITEQGQTLSVKILADMPRATYPDGTPAMLWLFEPSGTNDRNHMAIIGWLHTEQNSMGAGRNGLLRDTTLTILDVAGRLDTLPGFAQSIADDDSRDAEKIPAITWNYMIAPNLDKYLHYLLQWHSTALDVADFIWSGTGDDYPFTLLSSDGDSLWNQVDRRARAFVPDRVLTCDRAGRIFVVPDPMLADVADRTAVVQAALSENDWSDIRYQYQRHPRTHWLRAGAVLAMSYADLPLDGNGNKYIPTVFSIAPGEAPGQGLGAMTQGEHLAISQAALNAATGHRYARANARVGPLSITLLQDDGSPGSILPWSLIEPAYKEWVTLTVSAATAAQRGLTFTTARGLPSELNIRYLQTKMGLLRELTLTWEMETVGFAGQTVAMPTDVPPPGENPYEPPALPPTVPPDDGLIEGQELVAGIGTSALYRTADFQTPSGSGGPTWTAHTLTTGDPILSWVVDPFSPGYLAGVGSINGWLATATKIYRVADLFGTVTSTPVVTFATTALWRTIQASFGYYQAVEADNPWLICVSYYGNAAGHTGTWATVSEDGGVTWSAEVLVSSFYDSGAASNPIGLYLSPKTPGLAYTAAHVATANPATAGGYVSYDWGATWTALSATEDPDEPLPRFGREHTATGEPYTYSLDAPWPAAKGQVHANKVAGGPNLSENLVLHIYPPANTVRMIVSGSYTASYTKTGTFLTGITHMAQHIPSGVSGDSFTYVAPAANTVEVQTWENEFTLDVPALDWIGNREDAEAAPTTEQGSIDYEMYVNSTSPAVETSIIVNLRVIEIELDDSTIYVPSEPGIILPLNGQAGQIHSPWADNDSESIMYYGALTRSANREFALNQALGATVTDISPTVSSIAYGINRGHFAVRNHDLDRQFMALAGVGNDTGSSAGDDKVGLWVSSNAGAAWTNILAPVAASNVLQGLQIAFGADDSAILFAWGGYSDGALAAIYYSSDFGASLDSREGNLNSFGSVAFLGIAGGPLP